MGHGARTNRRTTWYKSLPPEERAKIDHIRKVMAKVEDDCHKQLDAILSDQEKGPAIFADVMAGKGIMVSIHAVELELSAGEAPKDETSEAEPAFSGPRLVDASGAPLSPADPAPSPETPAPPAE
jgi:hypothetical protein